MFAFALNRRRRNLKCRCDLLPANARAIARANAQGFTINLSADTLDEADELSRLKVAPVVTVLPPGQTGLSVTNDERSVVVCPATIEGAGVSCATCGICANPRRRSIIGFPAHGSGAEKVRKVFYLKPESV